MLTMGLLHPSRSTQEAYRELDARLLLNSQVGCRGPVADFGSADDYVIDHIIFDTTNPASIYARYPEFKEPEIMSQT
jgi:hypothetical protein